MTEKKAVGVQLYKPFSPIAILINIVQVIVIRRNSDGHAENVSFDMR